MRLAVFMLFIIPHNIGSIYSRHLKLNSLLLLTSSYSFAIEFCTTIAYFCLSVSSVHVLWTELNLKPVLQTNCRPSGLSKPYGECNEDIPKTRQIYLICMVLCSIVCDIPAQFVKDRTLPIFATLIFLSWNRKKRKKIIGLCLVSEACIWKFRKTKSSVPKQSTNIYSASSQYHTTAQVGRDLRRVSLLWEGELWWDYLATCHMESWKPSVMEVVGEENDTKHTTCFSVVVSHILAQLRLPPFFQVLSLGIFTVSLWCSVFKHCLNSTSLLGMYRPSVGPISTATLCAPIPNIFTL